MGGVTRLRLWLLRWQIRRVLRQRRRDLEIAAVWWAKQGVRVERLDPTNYEILVDLVNVHRPWGTREWQQQSDVLQMLDEIAVLGGDPSFRAVASSERGHSS